MTKATGEFELASWNEETYKTLGGDRKLTRASVSQTFRGDVAGEGSVQWLMSYGDDGTAHFVGLQLVDGAVHDSKGTFVLETTGDFDGKVAKWKATVVPGSGTGDLAGISGEGTFEAPMGSKAKFSLDLRMG